MLPTAKPVRLLLRFVSQAKQHPKRRYVCQICASFFPVAVKLLHSSNENKRGIDQRAVIHTLKIWTRWIVGSLRESCDLINWLGDLSHSVNRFFPNPTTLVGGHLRERNGRMELVYPLNGQWPVDVTGGHDQVRWPLINPRLRKFADRLIKDKSLVPRTHWWGTGNDLVDHRHRITRIRTWQWDKDTRRSTC